ARAVGPDRGRDRGQRAGAGHRARTRAGPSDAPAPPSGADGGDVRASPWARLRGRAAGGRSAARRDPARARVVQLRHRDRAAGLRPRAARGTASAAGTAAAMGAPRARLHHGVARRVLVLRARRSPAALTIWNDPGTRARIPRSWPPALARRY